MTFPRTALASLAISLLSACAPSRDAVFAPTRAEIEQRTGQGARWRNSEEEAQAAEDVVTRLLAHELSMDSAAHIALLNNRSLQARFAELGIARGDLIAAAQLANPSVSGEVLFPVVAGEGVRGGVGVSFDFLSSLYRSDRRDIALAALEATQLEVASAALDVTFEARAALLAYLRARQSVAVQRRMNEASSLRQELAQRLYNAGNVPRLTLLRASAAFESARAQLAQREADLVRARERVNRALGLVAEQREWTAVDELPELPELPNDQDESRLTELQRVKERSLPLEIARRRVEVAQRTQRLVDRQLLPELNVGVAGEVEDGYFAGPSASTSLPLFDQGQGETAVRDAELRARVDEYQVALVTLESEARRLREQRAIAYQRAQQVRDVVLPLRTRQLEEALLQYNAMALGPFELLEAKRAQLSAELQRIAALHDYWDVRLDEDKLLAGGGV